MIDFNCWHRRYGCMAVLLATAIQGCGSGATDSELHPELEAATGSHHSTISGLTLPLVAGIPTATTAPSQETGSIEMPATSAPVSNAMHEAPKPPVIQGPVSIEESVTENSVSAAARPTTTSAPAATPDTVAKPGTATEPEPVTKPEVETTPQPVRAPEQAPTQEAQAPPESKITTTVAQEPAVEKIDQSGFLNDRPSSIQCLEFPDNAIGFNDVVNDDWRSWVAPTKHHYSGATEHLSIVKTDANKSTLRQQLVPNSKGSQTVSAGAYLSSAKTYRLTQSIYLEPGFDWGGKNEGGKLGFGFGGGSAPTGGKLQTDGFTVRFMWRGNKDGTARMTIYSYAADRKQSLPYGDDHPLEGFNVPIGEWFDLAMEVTANSDISKSDGSLKAWANGTQLLEMEGIQWQASGDKPAVQRLMYTTFYGGNDSSWSPDKTTYIRFADVCWSPVLHNFEPLDPTLGSARNADQFLATKDSEGTIFSDFVQNDGAALNYAALADSPRAVIIKGLAEIELMLPIRDSLIDWHTYNALDRLNDSLAGPDWIDNYSVKKSAQTITHLYEAVRDSLAGASAPNAPAFVQSQLTRTSTQLAQAAIDLAAVQVDIARTTPSSINCADCPIADLYAQQSQDELVFARQLVESAPLRAVEHAEQARKSAIAAITSAVSSGK